MDLEGIVCKRKDSPYKVTEKPSRNSRTSVNRILCLYTCFGHSPGDDFVRRWEVTSLFHPAEVWAKGTLVAGARNSIAGQAKDALDGYLTQFSADYYKQN
jgi:hypothetical protein